MHRHHLSPLATAIALSLWVAQAAHAADTAAVASTEPSTAVELDATAIDGQGLKGEATTEGTKSYTTGVMSTATKMALSPRETPQATTVITRQRMDDQAMTSINDVVAATPGLFLDTSSGPGRQKYTARGFDVDNLMYDGIPSNYEGWSVGAQPNLAMFDRVEIVRGATGLVTGAGNPSAAINLIRKRPLAEQKVTLTGAAGSWDNYRGEVDASSPLNDSGTFRGRVVASYNDANSFIDDAVDRHSLFYAVTEADLDDATTLTLGLSSQKDKTNYYWGASMVGLDGHHLDYSRSYNPGTSWENKDQEINTVFAELRHRLVNDWNLQLNANYSEQNALFSGSYQSRWALDRSLARTVYQQTSDENQAGVDGFASGPFQAFGRTHELVVGASERIYDNTGHDYSPYAFDWPVTGGGKPDFVHTTNLREVTTRDAVYATTRLNLADPLKLIIGGRLDWYDYDNRDGEGDYKVTRKVTRYSGLIYDLDDHHSVYVSYSDIFTPQSSDDSSGSPVKPIEGKNYEVGVKGEYFDGALNASLALFRVDQENRAVEILDHATVCPTLDTCYQASGKVRSQGIDFELQGALTENWQVGGGYTYARVHTIKDDANPQNENQQFDTDSPAHLFKVTTTYRFQGELDKLRVGGNVYWQSRMYNDFVVADGSTYRLEQGAYYVADLMAGYQATKNLDLQVNANNIFDREYYSSISNSYQYGGDAYGTPRNLMLTAKYSF
jgi:outer membrane receptor for ferric coprogen and ferric-rhodotorulic acid